MLKHTGSLPEAEMKQHGEKNRGITVDHFYITDDIMLSLFRLFFAEKFQEGELFRTPTSKTRDLYRLNHMTYSLSDTKSTANTEVHLNFKCKCID